MDPITVFLGLGAWALLKKKGSSPAAVQQTMSDIDTMSNALMAGGVSKVISLKDALAAQIKGLGFLVQGVGHPPDASGNLYTEYVTAGPINANWTESDAGQLNGMYQSLSNAAQIVTREKTLTTEEAQGIIRIAQALAAKLYDFAVAKAQRESNQKKTL